MAVTAPPHVVEVLDPVLAHNRTHGVLAFGGLTAHGDGFVIGRDEELLGRVQTIHAQRLQSVVEIDHVPVVGRDQVRFRIDDLAGGHGAANDSRQNFFRDGLRHDVTAGPRLRSSLHPRATGARRSI